MRYLILFLCSFFLLGGCRKEIFEDCTPKTYEYLCKFKPEYYELVEKDSLRLCLDDATHSGYTLGKNCKRQYFRGSYFLVTASDVNNYFLTTYHSETRWGGYEDTCLQFKIDDYPFSEVYEYNIGRYDSLLIDSLIRNNMLEAKFERIR